jgi:hypothetical protein
MSDGNITYKSIDNGKILIRYFLGPVSFEESIDSWRDIIEFKVCKTHPKGVISDFSESGKMDSNDNISKLMLFMDENKDFFSGIVSASIVQQPDKTASGELVKQGISEHKLPLEHELFYSVENAFRWMHSKII